MSPKLRALGELAHSDCTRMRLRGKSDIDHDNDDLFCWTLRGEPQGGYRLISLPDGERCHKHICGNLFGLSDIRVRCR
jgi:hypothetical protein